MGHFDESEVQEIGLNDTGYPEFLRAIRKPPNVTGLAESCDAAATDGALSAGGNVIGVIPCGLKALRS